MAKNIINKYIWIADTIQRYGRITREELNNLWVNSSLSDGNPMSRRSFYNYRQGIAEILNIEIENDPSTFEYYIANDGSENASRLLNLLLDSASMSNMLSGSQNFSDRILLENVPSARVNLPTVMQALKGSNRITFTYLAYNRVNPSYEVSIHPYCVRLFKQLWYVIGYNLKDHKIKTYSLDRISDLIINPETFVLPDSFNASNYFEDCFGIMTSKGRAKMVKLKVSPNKSKYLRALPLHHSQTEEVHDQFSYFYYKLFITNDLVAEILSHGEDVQVISPPELQAMVVEQLKSSLEKYK